MVLKAKKSLIKNRRRPGGPGKVGVVTDGVLNIPYQDYSDHCVSQGGSGCLGADRVKRRVRLDKKIRRR